MRSRIIVVASLLVLGCPQPLLGVPEEPLDASVMDAGVMDAGVLDAGVLDAGVLDAGVTDAGLMDAGVTDAGVTDAGVTDAGESDAGVSDAGVTDAGALDAGPVLGNACPTQPIEAGRLVGVDFFPGTVGPAYASTASDQMYTQDVTGDGQADVLVLEYGSFTTTHSYRLRLFEGLGGLRFATEVSSTITIPAPGLDFNRLGDINGDGRRDVVLGYTTNYPRTTFVYVALQDAQGHFTLQAARRDLSACGSSSDERRRGLVVHDFDGDGRDDVLGSVSLTGLGGGALGLSLLRGSPSGLGTATCVASDAYTAPGISSPSLSTQGIPLELARADVLHVGDFNGDGRVDLFAEVWGQLAWFPRQADGGFTSTLDAGVPTVYARYHVRRANDGTRDVLLTSYAGAQITRLSWHPLDEGSGVLPAQPLVTLPAGSAQGGLNVLYGFALGDLNHDGREDLVVVGNQIYNAGDTSFVIGCDRGSHWELDGGFFPPRTHTLRTIIEEDGGTALGANVNADFVFYRLQ